MIQNTENEWALSSVTDDHREREDTDVQNQRWQELGRSTAGIAHELNNILGVISARSELIETTPQTPENRVRLKAIRDSVIRCEAIVGSILRFGRPSRPPEAFELTQVMEDASRLFKGHLIGCPQVQYRAEVGSELPTIFGNAGQVVQVLLNLLQNALQALDQKVGAITLSALVRGESVEVLVKDTGRGMSPEIADRIFSHLFSTKSNGSGMGLVISSRIIKEHGGEISFESRINQGTTFKVVLPILARGPERHE